jgi:hypothetical protein
MADEQRSVNDIISEAVQATSDRVSETGAMNTGWVMLATWTDFDGRQMMTVSTSEKLPTWSIRGLLEETLADLSHPQSS